LDDIRAGGGVLRGVVAPPLDGVVGAAATLVRELRDEELAKGMEERSKEEVRLKWG